jgi:hypothetical protein
MKKLFILTSTLALGALSTFAQGTINTFNSGSGVYITIGGVNVGKPATAAGYASAGPGDVSLTLYGAANGTALATLESSASILATGFNTTSTLGAAQGTEGVGGNPFILPTVAGVYDGTGAAEFIWYASTLGGQYSGWSGEATGVIAATGSANAPAIFGAGPGLISSFIIATPEPSTIALGGLGAAALLLFRRRK